MYAVIQTGGKQYRVEPGKTAVVEKLAGEEGTDVVFDQVLLVSSGDGATLNVGKPLVAGAKVTGQIVEQGRGDKLEVFKIRRRGDEFWGRKTRFNFITTFAADTFLRARIAAFRW